MPTLRLHQSARRADGQFAVTVEWQDGGHCRETVENLSAAGIDDATARELRWYFEDYLEQLYDPPVRARAERLEARMAEIGEALFRRLFLCDDARDLWAQLKDRIADTRVEIAAGVREATAIPWELLQDPRSRRPLALSARDFVRVQAKGATRPHRITLGEDEPLRLLLVICRPHGGNDVPFRSVASRLFRSVQDDARIQLTVLRPASYAQLGTVLEQAKEDGTPYHLVHFDGHGGFGVLKGGQLSANYASHKYDGAEAGLARGYLVFEDPAQDSGRSLIDGSTLGALLHGCGVAGLVLNACQSGYAEDSAAADADSGQADQVRAQGSLAQELIDAGVGAVLAMRYILYVETATRYVGQFYEGAARGLSFGAAATAARRALDRDRARTIGGETVEFRDWPVPLVFEANPLPLLSKPPRQTDALFALGAGIRGANDGLPPPPELGFIGRDETLLALDRAFDRHAVVLLHALAGSGKTTAAVEFARWYRDTRGIAGPIWFESFEGYLPLSRLLGRIEQSFGPALEQSGINWLALSADQRVETALQVLAQVPVLWIWDNVEPVAGFPAGTPSPWSAAEQRELAGFLSRLRGTKAKVLLTSRRDERGWLGTLPVPVTPPPMPMPDREALAAALAEHHGQPRAVVAVLRPLLVWTQGNPMTLAVVVGQALRDRLTSESRIAGYLARLVTGEAGFADDAAQGRDRSLAASLAYGFDSFSDPERTLLSLLHLFQGVVDVDALVAMGDERNPGRAAPYAGHDRAAWLVLLDRAAEIGLLTRHGGGYYSLHPALPWFLKDQFDRAFGAAAPPPLRGYVEAIGGLANFWADRFIDTGERGAIAALGAQEANLLHARALALRHGWVTRAVSAMQGLRQLYPASGRWAAWADLVEQLVPAVEDPVTGGPRPGLEQAWSLVVEHRVGLAEQRRDHPAALALLESRVNVDRSSTADLHDADPAALDHRQRHRLRSLGVALEQWGRRLRDAGDAGCIAALTEAKASFERLGLRRDAAIAGFNLGQSYRDVAAVRDLAAAEAATRESLALHEDSDPVGRAQCHGQLGAIAWARFGDASAAGADHASLTGHLQAAHDGYTAALSLLPADAHDDLAVSHHQLGVIFATIGAVDPAAGHYRQAIRHQEARGDRYHAALTRRNLAGLYLQAQRCADALDYASAALAGFESFGTRAAADVEDTRALIAAIEATCHQGGG